MLVGILNILHVCLNATTLAYIMFANDIRLKILAVEAFQYTDLFVSKSSPVTILLQTTAKCIVTYYGKTENLPYLAFIWSFSDFIRYMYHLMPSNKFIKYIRYSQYRVFYPIGVMLELIVLLPALSPNIQTLVSLLYIAIFPYMFNNTSKLESNVWITDLLTSYHKPTELYSIEYNKKTYVVSIYSYNQLISKLSNARYKWKQNENLPNTYTLKDYGIQISWRLVYIIEYLGALIAFPYLVGHRIDTTMWVIHYSKRILESIFIHSFSNDTMPFTNVFKNSAYYWGAGLVLGYYAKQTNIDCNIFIVGLWSICQIGNGFCHYYLANLRPAGSREHILPTNILFRCVTCPNYTFEIIGWGLFACLSEKYDVYFAVKTLFCLMGAFQMHVWAKGKQRRYKKLFGDKYKVSGVLLPGY
jgi:very-long-chain enoyl-CoA reductase